MCFVLSCAMANIKCSGWTKKPFRLITRSTILRNSWRLYWLVHKFWSICKVFTCFNIKPHWHVWLQNKYNYFLKFRCRTFFHLSTIWEFDLLLSTTSSVTRDQDLIQPNSLYSFPTLLPWKYQVDIADPYLVYFYLLWGSDGEYSWSQVFAATSLFTDWPSQRFQTRWFAV